MARGLSLGRRGPVTPIDEDELLAADPATAFRVDPSYIGQVLAPPRRDEPLLPRLGEAPPEAARPYRPGFMETLDAVLGGETITGARKRLTAEHQAGLQEAALMRAAEALFADDPQAMMLFQANPKALTDAMAKRYEPLQVTGGNTVVSAGRPAYTAPKLEVSDGHALSLTPRGATHLGQRPMSHQEEINEAEHLRQKLRDARAYEIDQARVGLEGQRVGLQGQALRHRIANAKAGGGSGGGLGGHSLGTKPWERDW